MGDTNGIRYIVGYDGMPKAVTTEELSDHIRRFGEIESYSSYGECFPFCIANSGMALSGAGGREYDY
jgi:hypothetical protein